MPDHPLSLEMFARVVHAARYRSRRQAKRELHELGFKDASGEELDEVLRAANEHEQAGEIIDRAEEIEAAVLEAARKRALDSVPPEGDVPEWLIGETPHWGRTFVIHFCPGGSCSFVGEVFDDREEAPAGLELHPLDAGQWFGNVTWMDGERPDEATVRKLMAQARRQLRLHDEQAEEGYE